MRKKKQVKIKKNQTNKQKTNGAAKSGETKSDDITLSENLTHTLCGLRYSPQAMRNKKE